MPASGFSLLLLATTIALGIAAVMRRSRKLGLLTVVALAAFVVYSILVFTMADRM